MQETTKYPTIADIKKILGLDKIPNVRQPIVIKKDGKHLYQVVGYNYPLRPETIERLKIPLQKILYEVDREQWHREMNEAQERESQISIYPWDEDW